MGTLLIKLPRKFLVFVSYLVNRLRTSTLISYKNNDLMSNTRISKRRQILFK